MSSRRPALTEGTLIAYSYAQVIEQAKNAFNSWHAHSVSVLNQLHYLPAPLWEIVHQYYLSFDTDEAKTYMQSIEKALSQTRTSALPRWFTPVSLEQLHNLRTIWDKSENKTLHIPAKARPQADELLLLPKLTQPTELALCLDDSILDRPGSRLTRIIDYQVHCISHSLKIDDVACLVVQQDSPLKTDLRALFPNINILSLPTLQAVQDFFDQSTFGRKQRLLTQHIPHSFAVQHDESVGCCRAF